MSRLRERLGEPPLLIGVVHLPPLPGYPGSPGLDALRRHALADLEAFAEGLDAILIENEHDRPHRLAAGPETVATLTAVCSAVVEASRLPVGVEILLNDPEASLAVAAASGCDFIRTDYFVDEMQRPEYGRMRIDPDGLIAYRERIGAGHVLVLADIQVKYATMLRPRPLAESARLAAEKGADAVVVSGTRTAEPPSVAELRDARRGGCPVLIGSGTDPANAGDLLAACDGAIVGTSILRDGRGDPEAVRALARAAGR